jgi:hypothetical protein
VVKIKSKKTPIFNVEAHTYTDPADNFKYCSVTRWIEQFKKPFDEQVMAEKIAKREGVPVEFILEEWHEKRESSKIFGTKVHKALEIFHKTGKDSDKDCSIILSSFKNLNLNFSKKDSFFEKLVYNRDLGIAGTSDIIVHNADKKTFNVYDFKTNKKVRYASPFGDSLLGPLKKYPCSEYFTYSLQLSMYAYLYKLMTGLEPMRLKIFWYEREKPEDYTSFSGNWQIINVPYLEEDLINCLSYEH